MQIKNFRRYVGAHPKSGVSCPDLQEVAKSFKIKTSVIDSDKNQLEKISKVLVGNEPHVCIVKIPPMQSLTPRVVMSMNLDGSFKKTGLENVAPLLNEKEHKDNLKSLAF